MKRIALILAAALFSVACSQPPPPPPKPKPKVITRTVVRKQYVEPHGIAPVAQPDSYSR